MKHIELHIKPALILLLKEKYENEVVPINRVEYNFYEWLLKKGLIPLSEFERLEKEANE